MREGIVRVLHVEPENKLCLRERRVSVSALLEVLSVLLPEKLSGLLDVDGGIGGKQVFVVVVVLARLVPLDEVVAVEHTVLDSSERVLEGGRTGFVRVCKVVLEDDSVHLGVCGVLHLALRVKTTSRLLNLELFCLAALR